MLANRVREYTATTGTGDVTLGGALPAHITFDDAFDVGDAVTYVIEDGDNYEIGTGTLVSAGTLSRTTVGETLVDGTYVKTGAAAINLSGNARVFCAATAEFLLSPDVQTVTITDSLMINRSTDGVPVQIVDTLGTTQLRGRQIEFDGKAFVNTQSAADLELRTNNTAAMTISGADQAVSFASNIGTVGGISVGGNITLGSDEIFRDVTNSAVVIGAGAALGSGPALRMFGNAHPSAAGKVQILKSSGATALEYDGSSIFDFQGSAFTGVGDVTLSGNLNATSQITISKSFGTPEGSILNINGWDGSATVPNRIIGLGTTGGGLRLEVNNTAALTLAADLSATFSGGLKAYGSSTFNSGGQALTVSAGAADHVYIGFKARTATTARSGYIGYPSTGTTQMLMVNELSGAQTFVTNGNVWLQGNTDGSALFYNDVTGVGDLNVGGKITSGSDIVLGPNRGLNGQISTGSTHIAGGPGAAVGANIVLRAQGYGGEENDTRLRAGSTTWLHYDSSEKLVHFQDNDLTTTGDLEVGGGVAVGGNINGGGDAGASNLLMALKGTGVRRFQVRDDGVVSWNPSGPGGELSWDTNQARLRTH